jgi:isopropylmalate/homocitrate/citramalate synthase
MSIDIKLVEVGPRDGLQNEARVLPVEVRVALIDKLTAAGLPVIEAGSFVPAKWVPKMADTAGVLQRIKRAVGVSYPVLAPNLRGFEDAVAAGADVVAIFPAASETFSQRNLNCSIDESFARFEPVCEAAREQGIKVRGYISCVLGCPYEGTVDFGVVADIAARLIRLGCYEISLGDTIGVGTPNKAREMLDAVTAVVPIARLAGHFHDTYGQAVANIYAVLERGVTVVDTSVAGLGGCPYADGASGNVATEDVVYLLDGMGLKTGVDMDMLLDVSDYIMSELGRPTVSKASLALAKKRAAA